MRRQNERRSTKIGKSILTAIISVFLFAVQIAILYFSFKISELKWFYILMQIFSFLVVLIIYRNVNASSAYKLTWTIIILAVPVLGIVLYLLIKNSQTLPKAKAKKIENNLYTKNKDNYVEQNIEDKNVSKFLSFIKKDTNYNIYDNSKVDFFNDGKKMFDDMFNEMKKAKKYIFLDYFIISGGKLYVELMEILKERASAGVEIKIIYDDVGSVGVMKRKHKKIISKTPNIRMVPFAPMGQNMNPVVNYRDHRKICIIDGDISYMGGANIADEYVHYISRFGYWRDNGIKLTGQATNNALMLFAETWYLSTQEILNFDSYMVEHTTFNLNNYVVPFGDGPMNYKNTFYDLFFSLFSSATKSICISTPYFIIDDMMIKSLVVACKMGVDVKILIPGTPDKKTAYYLTMAHLGEILKAGGKVYIYKKGFNHAKNIIIDDKYAFCGTVNIDYRSLFLHYECGALIVNDKSINKMQEDFDVEVQTAELMTYQMWKKRNIFSRIFAFVFRVFSPLF